jgi:hypothetical protein
MGNKTNLDSTSLCIKYLLFAMNFLYFAAGCAILGVSVWILLERNFISAMFGVELMTAVTVILIVAGAVIILVSFFGCCGSLMENKCMIFTYFVFMVILFVVMIAGGVIALVFRSQIGEEVRGTMRQTLQDDYGVRLEDGKNRAITDAWDRAQEFLHCCSVEDQSWNTYRNSEWYKIQPGVPEADKPYVPPSCCLRNQWDEYINKEKCQTWTRGPPGKQSGELNEGLHYRGCYYAGKDFAWEYSGYLIGLALGIGISMIAGIAFSIILYVNLSRQ